MSLYAEYLKERTGKDIIETDKGFATYQINGEECYIEDIYVRPDFRKSREASRMADKITDIAKERGCKYLTGSVVPTANGSTQSLQVLLGYGFKLFKSTPDIIWFVKEIK